MGKNPHNLQNEMKPQAFPDTDIVTCLTSVLKFLPIVFQFTRYKFDRLGVKI